MVFISLVLATEARSDKPPSTALEYERQRRGQLLAKYLANNGTSALVIELATKLLLFRNYAGYILSVRRYSLICIFTAKEDTMF